MPNNEPEKKHEHCEGHEHLVEVIENNTKAISRYDGTAMTVKWFAGTAVAISIAIIGAASTMVIFHMDKIAGRLDKISDSVSKIEMAQIAVSSKFDDHERRIAACEKK